MKNSELPAIPVPINVNNTTGEHHGGFTKREEIAKAAMQGILANHWCQNHFNKEVSIIPHEDVALQAVRYADALLLELEKHNQ